MGWIECEFFGLDCPLLADELVWREPVERQLRPIEPFRPVVRLRPGQIDDVGNCLGGLLGRQRRTGCLGSGGNTPRFSASCRPDGIEAVDPRPTA